MDGPLSERERFPLLTDEGRALLRRLYEHVHAPKFNHHCGDRITAERLARLHDFEVRLRAGPPRWGPGQRPPWVEKFLQECLTRVPHYRRWAARGSCWEEMPTARRADLAATPWNFVPDDAPLDDLIVYTTSGTTTGHPLNVLCHPEAAAAYLPLLRFALERLGIALVGGPGRVSIVLVCHQRKTYTYASISSFLDQAGFCKINLHPGEWRDPRDRERFLDDCAPEIYTGDPLAFAELAKLPLRRQPKALVSTAMTLLPGLRAQLESHFQCPVLDVYSLNESGPVAIRVEGGFAMVPSDLYVEVVDEHDQPCPPGERGEIALTGGRNPFLPLLRYRTGDWARLEFVGDQPMLVDLEGRAPVVFQTTTGEPMNNVDVSWALRELPLPRFRLHQKADGSLVAILADAATWSKEVRQRLLGLFGANQAVAIRDWDDSPTETEKPVQYSSDLSLSGGAAEGGSASGAIV